MDQALQNSQDQPTQDQQNSNSSPPQNKPKKKLNAKSDYFNPQLKPNTNQPQE